jgi:hypothetical protein
MIDPLTVVTNGILASASNIIIVDPLGYFVIKIEEVIEEVVVGGGGIFGQAEYEEPTKKYKKTIHIKVTSNKNGIQFEKSVELDDVNLTVRSAKVEDSLVKLTITNPTSDIKFNDYEIVVNIRA